LLESFSAVGEKTMRKVGGPGNPRTVRTAASSVSTVRAIRSPQKCFPNLASFWQVDAESGITFSKKDGAAEATPPIRKIIDKGVKVYPPIRK
jgi:hypothetical protein